MSEVSIPVGERFKAERLRLKLGVQEAAAACGVTRNAISKIERAGGAMPSGSVLQGFALQGADVQYVLTGKRGSEIDVTLFGVVEQALSQAYMNLRGDAARPERIRGRVVALAYNKVLGLLTADADVGRVALLMAAQTLLSLDDPSEPDLLERNLLRPANRPTSADLEEPRPADGQASGKVIVKGHGNRAAGRDFHEGGKKR